MNRWLSIIGVLFCGSAHGAELLVLDAQNYELFAPAGKEADAIYGDYVLRNGQIVAVIAAPVEDRRANLTVRNVGGGIIDCTKIENPRDQLSSFYPGGGTYRFDSVVPWATADWEEPLGATLAVIGRDKEREIRVGYELRDAEPFVRVVSTLTNRGETPLNVSRADGWRVDGPFENGSVPSIGLHWDHDLYWQQAYGLQASEPGYEVVRGPKPDWGRATQLVCQPIGNDATPIELSPGESVTWRRRLLVGTDSLAVQTLAYQSRSEPLATGVVKLFDGTHPVAGAKITVLQEGEVVGYGLSDPRGSFTASLPPGPYTVVAEANGHAREEHRGVLRDTPAEVDAEHRFDMSVPGYVQGKITGIEAGPDGTQRIDAIPAKIEFIGTGKTPSPDFGPESAVRGVQNLQYTPGGRFHCKLLPGTYRYAISHGPEYDAAFGQLTVSAGETVPLEVVLPRVVDSSGWLSSELHSHSSPSGDNTGSQAGRVLNLLAEHLEFCPCTEHQRIDVYDEHLDRFDAQSRMLTCAGMELTGRPLPLNHQNAFPLRYTPHTQDGGGPRTHSNPVTQIKRLAEWDDNSHKLVQTDHPDIPQMIGDRDKNGQPDEGFEAMFGYMDVIEVHPPELIFEPLDPEEPSENGIGTGGWPARNNAIKNWLQLLNLGYRVTGVVNTDAHYNWHGSGWLRNWVKSSTDDPAKATVAEMIESLEQGHVVMSNGPFMEVTARAGTQAAIPGEDLAAVDGKATVRVVVRCPNWIEVNRVQLFLNGRAVESLNVTARKNRELFSEGPEVFDHTFEVELTEDTHVVVACGGMGQSIGRMYGTEEWGRRIPVAVSNPIFIDTDGDTDSDGLPFEANGDGLGLPLPTLEGHKPSHGHDHPNHRH